MIKQNLKRLSSFNNFFYFRLRVCCQGWHEMPVATASQAEAVGLQYLTFMVGSQNQFSHKKTQLPGDEVQKWDAQSSSSFLAKDMCMLQGESVPSQESWTRRKIPVRLMQGTLHTWSLFLDFVRRMRTWSSHYCLFPAFTISPSEKEMKSHKYFIALNQTPDLTVTFIFSAKVLCSSLKSNIHLEY